MQLTISRGELEVFEEQWIVQESQSVEDIKVKLSAL